MEKIAILLFGLIWGSFLNVVIYRLPRGKNLAFPPSHCPQCSRSIKFYDNIPVVSYLILGGRCRQCRARIPVTYFMVELLTPLSLLLLLLRFGLSLHFFASCVFTSALIVLAFIDYYHQILPDAVTLPTLVLSLGYAFFRSDLSFLQALLGAGVGAGFLLLVYGVYYLLRKKEGMGLGDVTMMLMIGAFLGWKQAFFTLILASFVGALGGMLFILFRKKDLQYALPFGTFLAPGAYIALLWGQAVIEAYLKMFPSP